MRRSSMPVRSRIHSSDVSTICSRSRLVRMRSGTYMPVPTMVTPRGSGCGVTIRLQLLANVFVDALLHEARQGADRAAEGSRAARPVADEAHAIDSEQRSGAELFPVDLGAQPAQRRHQHQGSQLR